MEKLKLKVLEDMIASHSNTESELTAALIKYKQFLVSFHLILGGKHRRRVKILMVKGLLTRYGYTIDNGFYY